MNIVVYHCKIFIQGPTMNFSVVVLVFLPMILDVVYSDVITHEIDYVLELFPEFQQMKDEINRLKKDVKLAYNHLKNYRVKSEYIETTVLSTGQECWIQCTVTDDCTSASFQTESSSCELSRVTYINPEVLESSKGWEVFTKHTPTVFLQDKRYSLDFAKAKAHCEHQGLSIATFGDLHASYKNGYQSCSCGWAENGVAYIIMQEEKSSCMSSVGVIACTWQTTWNVYCKPFKSVVMNEGPLGRHRNTLDDARRYCQSKGTSLATMEDMIEAYRTGYEDCSCGWVDNGHTYVIMQKPTDRCMNGIGVIACREQSALSAWCKND